MSSTAPPVATALSTCVHQLLSPEKDVSFAELAGVRVLVRCDLNVPLKTGANGAKAVADRERVDASLPLLHSLVGRGARVVVASHLGRPKSDKDTDCSLAPVAELLQAALGAHFLGLASDVTGLSARALVTQLLDGQLCLLENTRFDPRDEANDAGLAQELASLCNVFVLDGFGVSHRAQASVSGVARCLPTSCRFPGPLVRRELQFLGAALDAPRRPFGVVLGGMKVKDKLGVLWALIRKADVIIVGGKMAFTFLSALGVAVGATQIEADRLEDARAMKAAADSAGVRLLLPCDVLSTTSLDAPRDARVVLLHRDCCSAQAPCLPADAFGADIGPASAAAFEDAITGCATLLWNGPMGTFEVDAFSEGTSRVMRALARAHDEQGATVVAAGGDSVAALNAAGLSSSFTHISTGGGASLQLLEGTAMPGLEALLN